MSTVVILGAGATRDCGGPLTDDILPEAFRHRDKIGKLAADLVADFLVENFGLPPDSRADKHRYPGLPLLLSLLDTAIARGHDFHPKWSSNDVRTVRAAVEETVSGIVELKTQNSKTRHEELIRKLGEAPTIISLNYDLLADKALMSAGGGSFPDYGCDVATEAYRVGAKHGTLFKIHGSLNWLYCSTCHYLEVGTTGTGPAPPRLRRITSAATCPGTRAGVPCNTPMSRVLITPSHMKDYRNPHIAAIWRGAEEALRNAEQVIIIGYSLPWDDVEVIYLLCRGLANLNPQAITVVEYARDDQSPLFDEHETGKRYRAVFGDIDWQCIGFEKWLEEWRKNG